MKLMKTALLTLFVFLFNRAVAADSGTEIEIDPIAYALKGYSVHLGEWWGAWKFDLNTASETFNSSQTKMFLSNANFTDKFVSYGAKIDYIGHTHVGFHAGFQWDYLRWTHTSAVNGGSVSNVTRDAGIRFGYRWVSGNFYLNPWVAFLYNYLGAGPINVEGQRYNQQTFQIFPTVHLGFRF